MRFVRKGFLLIVVAVLIYFSIFTFEKVTDGFTLYQIHSSLPPAPQFEVILTEEKKGELQSCLDQTFYYIGKGCQFYVFESQDGECVLKFFKHKHLRPLSWLLKIPMPQRWRSLCLAKIERREKRVVDLFTSCKLAYEKMPEESGLLFIHLNRSVALEKKVVLVDKLGCAHAIPIDQYEFVMQKKAIPLKKFFPHIGREELPKRVEQLKRLILARCMVGICDDDPAFVQNVAFLPTEERAIYVDIGRFYEKKSMMEEQEQIADLSHRLGEVQQWTLLHCNNLTEDNLSSIF